MNIFLKKVVVDMARKILLQKGKSGNDIEDISDTIVTDKIMPMEIQSFQKKGQDWKYFVVSQIFNFYVAISRIYQLENMMVLKSVSYYFVSLTNYTFKILKNGRLNVLTKKKIIFVLCSKDISKDVGKAGARGCTASTALGQ